MGSSSDLRNLGIGYLQDINNNNDHNNNANDGLLNIQLIRDESFVLPLRSMYYFYNSMTMPSGCLNTGFMEDIDVDSLYNTLNMINFNNFYIPSDVLSTEYQLIIKEIQPAVTLEYESVCSLPTTNQNITIAGTNLPLVFSNDTEYYVLSNAVDFPLLNGTYTDFWLYPKIVYKIIITDKQAIITAQQCNIIKTFSTIEILNLIGHELGHAIGMYHNGNLCAIELYERESSESRIMYFDENNTQVFPTIDANGNTIYQDSNGNDVAGYIHFTVQDEVVFYDDSNNFNANTRIYRNGDPNNSLQKYDSSAYNSYNYYYANGIQFSGQRQVHLTDDPGAGNYSIMTQCLDYNNNYIDVDIESECINVPQGTCYGPWPQ